MISDKKINSKSKQIKMIIIIKTCKLNDLWILLYLINPHSNVCKLFEFGNLTYDNRLILINNIDSITKIIIDKMIEIII